MGDPTKTADEIKAEQEAEKVRSAEALINKNKELLDELAKTKKRATELEEEKKVRETQTLKEQEKWKELAEKNEKDAADLRSKLDEQTKTTVNAQKVGAVKSHLESLGLIKERADVALGLFRVEDVKYDETNKVVLNAEEVAKSVLARVPEIFGNNSERMPNGGGGAPPSNLPGDMSDAWYNALPEAEKKKHYKAYMAKKGITIK